MVDGSALLTCTECGIEESFDDLGKASDWQQKHMEHTGHRMSWDISEFDLGGEFTTRYFVVCGVCDEQWVFSSEDRAQAYFDEHAEYTDHSADDIEERQVTTVDDHAIKVSIDALSGDEGAPSDVVVETLTKQGSSADRQFVESKIEDLKKRGEIYEPSMDRLRTI